MGITVPIGRHSRVSPQQRAMHPTLEYGCVVLGLAVGYQTGGYLGTGLVLSSVLALINLYSQGGWCSSKARLDGKTVVITGCNTGIGKITAMDLSKRGAKVVMLCRDTAKANLAAQEIKAETKGDVTVERMDLSSLNSVRDCVERLNKSLKKIDILINNAGVMMCPLSRTEEGFEMQIGTNHFGHFYLTNLLLPLIKKAAPGARIVNVSSLAHKKANIYWDDINWEKNAYDPQKAYGQSKLANILFTQELAVRLEGSGVNVYSLHPGVIATELGRHIKEYLGIFSVALYVMRPFLKTPESGAQTTIYCAVDESLSGHTGKYYADCREAPTCPVALCNKEDPARLWALSQRLTGLAK